MTPDQLGAFLNRPLVAVLSTRRPDGMLHSAAVWYEYSGGRFYFWTGENSVKIRNLRKRPEASVCIATHDEPFQYVSAQGRCELTKAGLRERSLSIAKRYYSEERARSFVAEDLARGRSILAVLTPERMASEQSA
jgi:PPOX class probable F420-dependent enzyme